MTAKKETPKNDLYDKILVNTSFVWDSGNTEAIQRAFLTTVAVVNTRYKPSIFEFPS